MSAIVGSCSSSGGGSATVIAGDKSLRCFVFLRKHPIFLEIVRNETSFAFKGFSKSTAVVIRASAVDSYENSSDFVKRMEKAWIISQQPRPVSCSSCASKGHVECKWCGGTGFFVIGDNVLCEFPSRNTSCVICAGKGSTCCADCKGTGFRAKWLEKLPPL